MRLLRATLAAALAAVFLTASAFGSTTHPTTVNSHSSRRSHKGRVKAQARRGRGQLTIDSARVTEIQQALIREHYLAGEATGRWDDATKAAMVKYQADQGWQTKLTPDSRALKKLGLGPDYSNAINAKPSSAPAPPASSTIPPAQSAGFAEAAGVSR
ncbi:MAG: peptidoglycan-binding domain-containing protein [Terracidiphilus sp.]